MALQELTDDYVCSLISKFGKQSIDRVKEWYDTSERVDLDFLKIPLHAKMFASMLNLLNRAIPDKINPTQNAAKFNAGGLFS